MNSSDGGVVASGEGVSGDWDTSEPIPNPNNVTTAELKELLELFSKTIYKAKDTHPKFQHVMQRCLNLFDMDYRYSVIPNTNGELSSNYPSSLVVLESEKKTSNASIISTGKTEVRNGTSNGDAFGGKSYMASRNFITNSSFLGLNHIQGNGSEATKLKDLCGRARFARCRARFPVSVILYNNKHVCRSATLSGGPEIYGRSSFDYFFFGGTDSKFEPTEDEIALDAQSDHPHFDQNTQETNSGLTTAFECIDRVRGQDIRLLQAFRVQNIVDLMVEKKKVKFGVNVTSSEKVDKENRYAKFNIISLPYPGCEFFKQYRDSGYCAERLVFEWNQGHVDANICVPSDQSAMSLDVKWSQYRDWDLVLLTQNYLKLLLAYLRDGDSGLLVHCISGWDRTPLFISLLRLSLWADGAIHKSLDAEQIMYLTLAYDWALFGHNLEDRLNKGEEILCFCFNFLKYIFESEFSVDAKPELTLQTQLSRTRNDSDTHLVEEGILLYGETCHTSPEGSNWSISSCGSSRSNKSQDNPPTFFRVPHDSWEYCRDAQHMLTRNSHSAVAFTQKYNSPALVLSGRDAVNNSCLITNSMMNSTTLPMNESKFDELPKSQLSNTQASTITASNSTLAVSTIADNKGNCPPNGTHRKSGLHGRTSPVAVPLPSRLHNHLHNQAHVQPRAESESSASIGSWQMITGNGSLRETMSSSDPSSTSSHSHPSKLSTTGPECIESSESSCTLVEQLTPVECKPAFRFFSTTPKSVEIRSDIEIETINVGLKYELELGLALDESLIINATSNGNGRLTLSTSAGALVDTISPTSTPTEDVTPTREWENEILQPEPVVNSNGFKPSKRRMKLESVRSRFCDLYDSSVSSVCRNAYDNGSSGGGLGYFIGNFASKVGIRSAPHRTTQV